jgi:hypothetical protein
MINIIIPYMILMQGYFCMEFNHSCGAQGVAEVYAKYNGKGFDSPNELVSSMAWIICGFKSRSKPDA